MVRELFNNERRWIAVERDDIIPFVVVEVVLLDRSRKVSGSFDFFFFFKLSFVGARRNDACWFAIRF